MSAEIRTDSDSDEDEQNAPSTKNWKSFPSSQRTNSNINTGSQYHAVKPTEKPANERSEQSSEPSTAPDGGWGWMVTFGSMVIGALVVSLLTTFGLFINEFVVVFPETSKADAAWIPAIMVALWNGLCPLTSALVKVFSCRSVSFVGGLIMSVGLSLSFFTTTLQQLYFTFGFMGGVGAGLCLTPGIILMSSYFEKRRGLASGLCMMGGGIGNLIMPPVVEYLLEKYGYRGCILILGAITLNVCAAAALFRPPDTAKRKKADASVTFAVSKNKFDILSRRNSDDLKENLSKNRRTTSVISSISRWWKAKETQPQESILLESRSWRNPNIGGYYEMNDAISSTPPVRYRNRTISIDSSRILPEIPEEPEEEEEEQGNEYINYPGNKTRVAEEGEANKNANGCYENVAENCKQAVPSQGLKSSCGCWDIVLDHLRLLVNPSQLKSPIFYVLTFSYNLTLVAFPNFILFIPPYVTSLGFSKEQAAWLVSISAIPNIIGRFGVPATSDCLGVQRKYLFCAFGFLATFAMIATVVTTDYVTLTIIMVVFGAGIGGCLGISVPMFLDYMSNDQFPAFYGMVHFIQCILFLTVTPLIGRLVDTMGGYLVAMLTLASVQAISSITVLLDVVALKELRPSHPGMKSNEVV